MSATANVFLIDGENEFGMAAFITDLEKRLGSSEMAEVNITRMDGKTLNLDEFKRACFAMPFLTTQRMVVVQQATTRLTDSNSREKFIKIIENLPETTLLVLSHNGTLTDMRRDKKPNWLEMWFKGRGGKYVYRRFDLPKGQEMVGWIKERVKQCGGRFTPAAAVRLAALVGDEPRRADQEIHKLLDYVNYARPVEAEDVDHLTPDSAQVGDFALVNALRSQNVRQAQSVLHKMLAENEPTWLLGRIVTQFRQLILVREMIDEGAMKEEVLKRLGGHPYAISLAMEHARHYEMETLEKIYWRLHELDYAIKKGEIEGELALDLLVVELTDKSRT